ncbi:PAS domain-containing protein [Rhodoferax sp. 4810]|nr:PAS domain-containing protein [Rhodoferax jenense]
MTTRSPRKKGEPTGPTPPVSASAALPEEAPLSPPLRRLRETAEARLAATLPPTSAAPADRLLHELQVHQIELEMQNEALHEAQAILEESRDRYLDLYELAPIGYLTLSVGGMIEEINLSGARLLHEHRQTLLHKRFAHYVAPSDQRAWQIFWQQVLQGRDVQRGEIDLKGQDGSVTTVRVSCTVIQTTVGLQGVRLSLSDITDLKQALAELQTREDRLQLAKAASGLGLFDDNLSGGDHMVDGRFREIWGFGPIESVSFQQVVTGLHPDDRHGMQAALARAVNPRGNGTFLAQYRVINRVSGAVHHVSATGRVYFKDGVAVRIIGTVKDVTDHVQLEGEVRTRRHAMELLAHQQIASQTAAAIAHEINQPLISVSAYSEAALRMLHEGVQQPQKLTRALEGAVQQAQRAGRALHELLDFLHKGETATESLDLNQVVSEAMALAEEGSCCSYPLVLEPDPDLPPVQINRLQIQKVVVNLLQNACEAMRAAGMPKESIRIKVTVRHMSDIPMAQVSVYDSGPGFSQESAKRAFDPFFTTKTNGIGLGLAISRALIEANGGQLWVDPAPGPGAALHFSVPFSS